MELEAWIDDQNRGDSAESEGVHLHRPTVEELDAVLDDAAAAARAYLTALPEAPAARPSPRSLPSSLPPAIGTRAALAELRARYEDGLSASAGARYWGFVTGGVTPAALAADWLVSAYDQNLSNDVGSVATNVEREALTWLRQLFELPAELHPTLVTGATMANTTALAAARQWAGARVGADVAVEGLDGRTRLRVLAGSPHSSILKALSVLGIGRNSITEVATHPGTRIVDPDALERALELAPSQPTIVVASAGEVNAGEFDELGTIAALCRRHDAWLHVDAAFGMYAVLDPARRHLVAGIGEADSITVDLHKWLNVPYDAGVVFCRHPKLQRAVFRASAAYLGDSDDPLHSTPENSRRFRALPLWMSLRAYGRDGIGSWVTANCELARMLADRLATLVGLEVIAPVPLNVVCFALRNPDPDARDRLLQRLQEDGELFLTPTTYRGRAAIRAALSTWRTTATDVERAVMAIETALRS